jgi:hypothetical protein
MEKKKNIPLYLKQATEYHIWLFRIWMFCGSDFRIGFGSA